MAWLSGYTFRKKGAVNATAAGAQTNYQLKLVVGESSGAFGEDISCEEHCIDFPNDIRFTKEDGTTKHDYWIDLSSLEGTTPNQKVDVLIEVASIPASGYIDFYMYYGKSSDSGESNIANTFLNADEYKRQDTSGVYFEDFLDDNNEESRSNIIYSVHKPVKYSGNPVFAGGVWDLDKNYNDVQYIDGKFKMWYHGRENVTPWNNRVCYAESNDGLAWTRPNLGLIEYGGNTNNNIIIDANHWGAAVYYDPIATDPDRKYILLTPDGTGVPCGYDQSIYFSPDGKDFTFGKVVFGPNPECNGHTESMSLNRLPDGRWIAYSQRFDSRTNLRAISAQISATDDIMGDWIDQGIVIPEIDSGDQRYSIGMTQKHDRFYGFINCYNKSTEQTWMALWVSRNGLTWKEKDNSWVPRGSAGAWDESMIFDGESLVKVADEWWYYYSGFKNVHNNGPPFLSNIGLAKIDYERIGSIHADEGSYEDFTTFTEVDPATDRIQKTTNHVDHLAHRNETTYAYKDYGVDHFTDFTHKTKIRLVPGGDTYSMNIAWGLANTLGDANTIESGNHTQILLYLTEATGTELKITLRESHSGTGYYDLNAGGFSIGSWVYAKIVKSGTTLTAYLYSDSDYTILVDTLTLTLHANHSFRYLYACNTWNTGDTYKADSDIENFDLGGGSYEDFTTFTEVDVAIDRIQKTAQHVDHLAYRNETTYLYKDYGAAHFGDFTHKVKIQLAGGGDAYNQNIVWGLANTLNNAYTTETGGNTQIILYLAEAAFSVLKVTLRESHSSTGYYDLNEGGFNIGDWIYAKIVKSGTSLNAYLYSDSDYTILVDTLTLTLHADHTFRNLYACNTWNTGAAYAANTNIENFDLGEGGGAPLEGIFISKNFFTLNSLKLNADASGGGTLKLELLDVNGNPIAGYAKADFDTISTNGYEFVPAWGGETGLPSQPVKLKFYLESAYLYSYLADCSTITPSDPIDDLGGDWIENPNNSQISNNLLSITEGGVNNEWYQRKVRQIQKNNIDCIVEARVKTNVINSNAYLHYGGAELKQWTLGFLPGGNIKYLNSGGSVQCGTYNANDWHKFSIVHHHTSNLVDYYLDDVLKANSQSGYARPTWRIVQGEIALGTNYSIPCTLNVDWIFARKYVSPMPTWGSWSEEEEQITKESSVGISIDGANTKASSVGISIDGTNTKESNLGLSVSVECENVSTLGLTIVERITKASSVGISIDGTNTKASSVGISIQESLTKGSSLGISIAGRKTKESSLGLTIFEPVLEKGLFYGKLGNIILETVEPESFRISEEINRIPSFEFEVANSEANRTAIAANPTALFKIYWQHHGVENHIFTGIINADGIEYVSLTSIRITGFSSYAKLGWPLFKHLDSADAEPVNIVLDYNGAYTDYTAQANSPNINDVIVTFGTADHCFYVGEANPFWGLQIKYSTKGVPANAVIVVEFSKGSGVWATLDVLDETNAFTEEPGTYDIIIPHPPSDWAREGSGGYSKFWIRWRVVSGSYSTSPKLDQMHTVNVDVYRVFYLDTSARAILLDVLDGTEYSMDATDACPEDEINIWAEYESPLRVIAAIPAALTWIDTSGSKKSYQWWIDDAKKVHIKQKRGTTHPNDITGNLTIFNNLIDYFNISNRLIGFAKRDGLSQIRAIVEDKTSQTTHALREFPVPKTDLGKYITLKASLEKDIAMSKNPMQRIKGSVTTEFWGRRGYEVGDTVTLHQSEWVVEEGEFQIVKVDIGPILTQLDLGISREHLEGLKSNLKRTLDISNVQMHGSTSLVTAGPETSNYERKSDGSVFASKLKIEIPSEVIKTHKVLLSWTIGPYRASVNDIIGDIPPHAHEGYALIGGAIDSDWTDDAGGFTPMMHGEAHIHAVNDTLEIIYSEHNAWYPVYWEWEKSAVYGINHRHHVSSVWTDGPDGTDYALNGLSYGSACGIGDCVSDEHYALFANDIHDHLVTIGNSDYANPAAYIKTELFNSVTGITPYIFSVDSDQESVEGHIHDGIAVLDHPHGTPAIGGHIDHGIAADAGGGVSTSYGIHEEPAGTILELLINSEIIGQYSGDQKEVRIDGYLTTGTNTIEIQPITSELNKKGSATIWGSGILFIEPKKF